MTKELCVLVNDRELGSVHQAANGRLRFVYDDAWRQSVDAFPLSLSMPLGAAEHSHTEIVNYLWGLLPDRASSLAAIAAEYKVSVRSAFALISAVGEDLAGAVQIVPPNRVDKLKTREGIVQVSENRLAKFLDDLVADHGKLNINEDAGFFSLAGVQAKKAVYWVNGKWYEPRGRTPSTHIIKPPMPGLEGQVENEHFCLRLASALGLRTCETSVEQIAGKPNIVATRYDRLRILKNKRAPLTQSGGRVVRVHQEDMCQAMGIDPAKKYQAEGGPGMQKIMELLAGSGDPATDRSRFMRACAFNFVIVGPDAHGKNFSVLVDVGGRYRLAPLYDINSMLPYDLEKTRKLAMTVGGEGRWRSIGPTHWEKAARLCGYPPADALAHVRDIVARAPAAARQVLKQCRSAGLETPALVRLVEQLDLRCKALAPDYN
ncbi:type II toxin-antitoxin system HipA family toxin [Vitreimonas flagellata]|uniref:type II toxin-antitoxin system HipA family toxin n=1 Tax=Vitreimonas flagellata TaxID=2560861 RepID=UPI0010752CCC|nr:type II toxin-antitoxin system HipA family toxin [Vitreimonas flagellata]